MSGLRFCGHAALFDVVDRAGDVFRRGAFADAVEAGVLPLLWQHQGTPVGAIIALREDARGLAVGGRIDDPDVAGLVRRGALSGLSVGYRALCVRQGARRAIGRVGLVEVSLVAVPMQPGARVEAIEG